jgi:hypothetical protein
MVWPDGWFTAPEAETILMDMLGLAEAEHCNR